MATKKKLTEEQEKEILLLQANNEMLERTKEEAKLRGNEKSVERIQLAQNDVIEQIKKIDPTALKDNPKKRGKKKNVIEEIALSHDDDDMSVFDILSKKETEEKKALAETKNTVDDKVEYVEQKKFEFNNIDPEAQYDIVTLPSNGECYKSKCSRVPVAYLTANDENLITSPSLYKDGIIIDFLLKSKVMNSDIDIDDLCSGDADAIILFLRATSYGTEFPISARDPETKETIEGVVDLSTLKYKEFKLKADENGYFDYEMPLSKDKIKFKFLTRKDEKNLRILSQMDNDITKAVLVEESVETIKNAITIDKKLESRDKTEMLKSFEKITEWANKMKENDKPIINRAITNRMEMNIVSVNGEEDRRFIAKYVKNMNTRDSLAFRRYVIDNEPGVDFEINVNRLESMGGGSFKTFLEWDDTVFLNIA